MKLIANQFASADTITTDDDFILGVVYYSSLPVPTGDDSVRRTPREVFHEWFGLNNTESKRSKDEPPPNTPPPAG